MKIICYACGRGEYPENTLEGIQHCQTVNKNWRIEMDIQLTKDHQLVLFHDYELERITGHNGRIDEVNLSALRQLNVGHHFQKENQYIYRNGNALQIPTVEEVFQRFPTAHFLLDVHTNDLIAVRLLLRLIDQYNMENQIMLVSHYDKVVTAFKEKRPHWTYGVPTLEAKKMVYSSFLFLDNFFPIQSDVLMLPKMKGSIKVLTKRVIQHAKKRNKELWVWLEEGTIVENVNTLSALTEMKALGADGVFTDFPQRLLHL